MFKFNEGDIIRDKDDINVVRKIVKQGLAGPRFNQNCYSFVTRLSNNAFSVTPCYDFQSSIEKYYELAVTEVRCHPLTNIFKD